MIVTIDTDAQTVTIKGLERFGELVDWEDYLDYEVIIESPTVRPIKDYLDDMANPDTT
jgi:hypothetical protein